MLGGFDSDEANLSEGYSSSMHKENIVSGKEFSRLATFEAYAQLFDGVNTKFEKLYLKPYFLKNRRTAHTEVLKILNRAKIEGAGYTGGESTSLAQKIGNLLYAVGLSVAVIVALPKLTQAAPNVCTVVNTV
jgi:hypothetical protein